MNLTRPFLMMFLACWFQYGDLPAQYNQTEIFTIQDGMALTETSQLYSDQRGRLWILHYPGFVSLFNGRSFTTFTPQDIGSNRPGGINIESKKGIWLVKNQYISLYDENKWRSWETPGFLTLGIVDPISDVLIVADTNYVFYKFNHPAGAFERLFNFPRTSNSKDIWMLRSRTKAGFLIGLSTSNASGDLTWETFFSSSLDDPDWKIVDPETSLTLDWHYENFRNDLARHGGWNLPRKDKSLRHEFLQTSAGRLFFIQVRATVSPTLYEISVFEILTTQQYIPIARFLLPHAETNLACDRNGHLWISSHSGLTRVYPEILQCYDNTPGMVNSLHVINEDDRGRVWFGGYYSGLCYFENNIIHPSPPELMEFSSFLPGAYRNNQGQMGFWLNAGMLIYDNGNWTASKYKYGNHSISGFCFAEIDSTTIAAGLSGHGLGITRAPLQHDNTWKIIDERKGVHLQNVLTISKDHAGRLWLGRYNEGVALYDLKADTARTWRMAEEISYGMMSSAIDPEGRLWMGCSDGLRIIEKPEKVDMFSTDLNSIARRIQMDEAGYSQVQFVSYHKPFIVFGNMEGYGFLDLPSYNSNPLNPVIYYTSSLQTGLSSEQNCVLTDSKGFLWIGQDKGALRIDTRKIVLDTSEVEMKIETIQARGLRRDSTWNVGAGQTNLHIPFGMRNVTLEVAPTFTGLLNNNVLYQYSLLDPTQHDTFWSPLFRLENIRIDILPPGKNTFLLRGVKNNQVSGLSVYTIYIPPRITERPSFWIVLFGLLSLSGIIFTRHVYRQRLQLRLAQINLAEQNREKNQFQISAIANALNPHFIKNTLAWMQSRFWKDEQVVDVIDRLAFNIGSVFSHSRKGEAFHTLEEEMKVVENFLAIQLAIYGPFIEFIMPDPVKWKPWKEVRMPLLQIQIHVENAIEHGLRNKPNGDKKLQLDIEEMDEYHIRVTIEDNGIGRAAAKARGSRGSQQGTMMLDRVYELYNQHNAHKFQTQFDDLADAQTGEVLGTRVTIIIPKSYKPELL